MRMSRRWLRVPDLHTVQSRESSDDSISLGSVEAGKDTYRTLGDAEWADYLTDRVKAFNLISERQRREPVRGEPTANTVSDPRNASTRPGVHATALCWAISS
jgi:hypothetical protein